MKTKRIDKAICFTIVVLLTFLLFPNFVSVRASAETEITLEEITENVVFIAHKKGYSEEKRNILGAAFYLPEEYYFSEYTYGVAVFPEWFIKRYELYGDYFARKENDGLSIMNIQGISGPSNGYRITVYNVVNLPDSLKDTKICFAFYVKDEDGNIAYTKPYGAKINETELTNVTNAQWESLLQKRFRELEMQGQFEIITEKLNELAEKVWIYSIIVFSAVVVVWGAYIGIRIAVAKKNEQLINAKGMLKGLVIGIIVMAILAVGAPLLIKGLAAWAI